MGEMRNTYKVSVGRHEWKRLITRPRRRWGIILEWILPKQCGNVWTGWILFSTGTL